jgi:glycosyltransferase involved in cell wall biosynthesis
MTAFFPHAPWMLPRGGSRPLGVVIPTLNCAATLPETLVSIAGVPEVSRVIVADSGSTDGTLEIAAAAGVELIEQAPAGMYASINAAISRLDTPWVTYINGDDLLRSGGVRRLLTLAAEADILYGPVDFLTADGSFIHCWHSAPPRAIHPIYRAGGSALLQQGTLFRRNVFDDLGGFDARFRFVSDADFWFRAAERRLRFVRITYPPVAAFRMRAGQLSHAHADAMRAEHAAMLSSHGVQAGDASLRWPVIKHRVSNARSYLLRCLRRRDLTGITALHSSYDLAVNQS